MKHCPSCDNYYPRTVEYFYQNIKKGRKTIGFQSYCRICWKEVNKRNKTQRKVANV